MLGQQNDPPALSTESIAWLEAFLHRSTELTTPYNPPPNIPEMVCYLSGLLAADALYRVERALVADVHIRQQLQEIERCLEKIKRLPWSKLTELAQEAGLQGSVAQSWKEIAISRGDHLSTAHQWWQTQGWDTFVEQVRQGQEDALAAWAAFWAFGAQLRAELQQPRHALARSEAQGQPWIVSNPQEDLQFELTRAEVLSNGALHILLNAQSRASGVAAPDGVPIHLALTKDHVCWPIASGILQNGHMEWMLSTLGTTLGLPQGPFPVRHLQIAYGEVPTEPSQRQSLWAEMTDAQGASLALPSVAVELTEPPYWRNGQLHVTLVLPQPIRLTYPNAFVCLSLILSPQHEQFLGAWPVRDWTQDARILRIAAPGGTHDSLLPAANVRVRLQSSA